MEQIFAELKFMTEGEGLIDITNNLNQFIQENNFYSGIFIITSLHTSCSLTINENADPNVLKDLKKYMQSLVPYNSYSSLSKNKEETFYKHYQEGEDDMPAHIKTALTNTNLTLSIIENNLKIGIWQGIYLFEHRIEKHVRSIFCHMIGEI